MPSGQPDIVTDIGFFHSKPFNFSKLFIIFEIQK